MALILRNGGSQSPDRWLREPRNNHFVGSNRKKVYETYDEVFEFACNKKKERIEKVAEKNLGRIPKCAYDAMLRYDVEALIRRDVIAA